MLVVLVLGIVGAGLGVVGASAIHWWVVTPSDDELLAVARGVSLPGVDDDGSRVLSGAWLPSLRRPEVHWDATARGAVDVGALAASLHDDGWRVLERDGAAARAVLRGARGPATIRVHVLPRPDDRTLVSTVVSRGTTTPSLTVTLWTGAAAGALLAGWLGAVLGGRRR